MLGNMDENLTPYTLAILTNLHVLRYPIPMIHRNHLSCLLTYKVQKDLAVSVVVKSLALEKAIRDA